MYKLCHQKVQSIDFLIIKMFFTLAVLTWDFSLIIAWILMQQKQAETKKIPFWWCMGLPCGSHSHFNIYEKLLIKNQPFFFENQG